MKSESLSQTPPPAPALDPSNEEDVALMLRAAKGDDEAFCALVRKHEQPLMNYFDRNGVHTDVEDLAQLTFLKLHRARRDYRPTAKFTTYLYLLARQVMLDYFRRDARREQQRQEMDQEIRHDPAAGTVTSNADTQIDVHAALATLTPALRETVVLVVMQGLTYAEAAEILSIPVGTAKSRVNTALRQLREFFDVSPPTHRP